jgi:hypothetical protein
MNAPFPQVQNSTGPFARLLHFFGGIDRETLRDCPGHDHNVAASIGALQGAVLLYMTALFSTIADLLFSVLGQPRPELVAVGFFLAAFVALIDRVFIMSAWHLAGIDGVKRGGLDISGGPAAQTKARVFLAIRVILSIGLAQLTACFLSLLVFQKDIERRIDDGNLHANASVISDATKQVDDGIQRATDTLHAQQTRVANLANQVNALRQNQIDPSANDLQLQQAQQELAQLVDRQAKAAEDVRAAETFASNERGGIKGNGNSGVAGEGPRHRAAVEQLANAQTHAREVASALDAARGRLDELRKRLTSAEDLKRQRAHDQLPEYERALSEESGKLDQLKAELAAATHDREGAIRNTVENAPGHVHRDDGFLARIRMLEQIAAEDSKIAFVIVLFEITAFGFEISAILGKASYIPTSYASFLASKAYMAEVRIVDGMMEELNAPKSPVVPPIQEASVSPPIQDEPPPPPPPPSSPPSAPPSCRVPANDNHPDFRPARAAATFDGFDPPPPPKRPRGRPRKSSLN